jgi:hypothetical protein
MSLLRRMSSNCLSVAIYKRAKEMGKMMQLRSVIGASGGPFFAARLFSCKATHRELKVRHVKGRTVSNLSSNNCYETLVPTLFMLLNILRYSYNFDRLCGLEFLATDPEARVRFPALPEKK